MAMTKAVKMDVLKVGQMVVQLVLMMVVLMVYNWVDRKDENLDK